MSLQVPGDYATALEQALPGFVSQVRGQQLIDEPWWETAQRIVTNVVMTQYQYQILQAQIERAKAGQSAAAIPEAPSATRISTGALLAAGVGMFFLMRKA